MEEFTVKTSGYRLFNGTEIFLGSAKSEELGLHTSADVHTYEAKLANELRESIPDKSVTFINFERDDKTNHHYGLLKYLGIAGIIQIHTADGVRLANMLASAMLCYFDVTTMYNIGFTPDDIGKMKLLIIDDERYSLRLAEFNADDVKAAIDHIIDNMPKIN